MKKIKDQFTHLSKKLSPLPIKLMLSEVELRQFTGLKDKNGKEIFEGDIISFLHQKPAKDAERLVGVMKWIDHDFCFALTVNGVSIGYCSYELEVIGNIYENPELLNSK